MTTRRFRGGNRRFRRGPRRRTTWSTVVHGLGVAVPSGFTSASLLPAAPTAGEFESFAPLDIYREGLTVVRILLDGIFKVSDPTAVNSANIWHGIVPVNQNEIDANAFPLPGADEADWMYLTCGFVEQRETIIAGYDPASFVRWTADLRARRRLRSSQGRILSVLRNDDDSLGNGEGQVCIRSLWMLP